MGKNGILILFISGSLVALLLLFLVVVPGRISAAEEKTRTKKPGRGAAAARKSARTGAKSSGAPRKPVCPNCRVEVRFISEYRRHWCDDCEDYVRPVAGAQMKPAAKKPIRPKDRCPSCGTKGDFSDDYNDHYCWECEGYFKDM